MEFREIEEKDKAEWDALVVQNPESFLQSFAWGKFQAAVGRPVFRFALRGEGGLLALAQAVEHRMPGNFKYWYVPRGPVLASGLEGERAMEILRRFLGELGARAKTRGVIFLRFDPAFPSEQGGLWEKLGLKKISGSVQPQDTLLLDLTKSKEELLAEMKQKTRYNLRLSEKKGVEVAVSGFDEKGLEEFWRLTEETSARDGIVSHPESYYRRMLEILAGNGLECRLYRARFDEKTIAANLVLFCGDYAVYLHGASSNAYRNLMAPYLLQWRQIEDAKAAGCRTYDFWGITRANLNPKWAGITRFKQGFGGQERSYVGAYDLPVKRALYALYTIGKRL